MTTQQDTKKHESKQSAEEPREDELCIPQGFGCWAAHDWSRKMGPKIWGGRPKTPNNA